MRRINHGARIMNVKRLVGAMAFLTCVALAACAKADLIVNLDGRATPVQSGGFDYSYVLENLSSSTLPIIGFDIEVGTGADLSSITGPTGWTVSYRTGDPRVSWESPDASFDIAPGDQRSFSFHSFLGPASRTYNILSLDEDTGEFQPSSGQVVGPSTTSVPEPASMRMSLLGLALVSGYVVRKASSRT